MRFRNQYALNSFRRIQDFLDERVADVGSLRTSEGRKQLDEAVAQLDAHGDDQSSTDMEIEGQASLQLSLENDLRKEHLQPIADFASGKLRGVPEYSALTQKSSRLIGKPLVRVARAVAIAAGPHVEDFTNGGFPADTIEQLTAIADRLEGVIDERANLKVRRAGSVQGMVEQTQKGNDAVKMLSAVIQKQFAKDKTFLASWRSAKRVVLKPGFPRGSQPVAAPTVPVASTPVSAESAAPGQAVVPPVIGLVGEEEKHAA